MKLAIADDQLWDTTWEKHASASYPENILATEQKEQGEIEDLIAEIVGDDFSLGFDWIVQHFDTPRFVFTLTLQNAALFNRSIIERIITAVTQFGERWKLNLGLVDAIHNGVWDSTEDLATMFFVNDSGIVIRHSAYPKLDRSHRKIN